MSRRYPGEYTRRRGRRSGGRRPERRVSNPLIVVALLLFAVGLLGTVIEISTIRVPHDIAIWSLICSNLLLLIGAFSREM